MKTRFIFCLLFVFSVLSIQAQPFTWATGVSGTEYEYGVKSLQDANNNTYLLGHTTGNSFKYNNVTYPTNGKGDAFLAKLDANKALVWIKSMGGDDLVYPDFARDMHLDAAGNLYLLISSAGNNFTYNGQVLSGIGSNPQSGGEGVILKIDAAGNHLWHDSGQEASYFRGVTTDSEGNVYLTGQFYAHLTLGGTAITLINPSNVTTSDLFVAKYTANGTLVWAKNAGGLPQNTFAYGIDIEVHSQTHEVIVLGGITGTVVFDGLPVSAADGSSTCIVMASYTQDGTLNWVKRLFDGPFVLPYSSSVAISNSGVIGVCGYSDFYGLMGFYNGDGTVISEQGHPSINEIRFYSIAFNQLNEAYVSGWCNKGTIGISPGTVYIPSITAFIVKVDTAQQVKWLSKFYSSSNENRIQYHNGKLSYASRIDGSFLYNTGQSIVTSQAGDALFGEVVDQQLPLALPSFEGQHLRVYPNPTNGLVTLEADGLQKVEVYNLTGGLILQTTEPQINLSDFSKGVYLLKVMTEQGLRFQKIVLQ